MIEPDDAQLAEATLSAFVAAVIAGDELSLSRLVYGPSLESWGRHPGGISGAFLDGYALSRAQLSRLGIVQTARVLPGRTGPSGLVAFGLIEGDGGPTVILEPTPARAVALIKDGAHWRVWGTPSAAEFADATLVKLPSPSPIREEMLSVLGADWLMAVGPHIDVLASLTHPAGADAPMVSPKECAHSIAAISMLVFAIESIGARLASLGRISTDVPLSIVASLSSESAKQELSELIVVRNVITHNHVWRVAFTLDAALEPSSVDELEHMHGIRGTRMYRTAVEPGEQRTKTLNLHVIPTSIRRSDVHKATIVAVRTFDHLAALDVPNMRSLSEHMIKVDGRLRRVREVAEMWSDP